MSWHMSDNRKQQFDVGWTILTSEGFENLETWEVVGNFIFCQHFTSPRMDSATATAWSINHKKRSCQKWQTLETIAAPKNSRIIDSECKELFFTKASKTSTILWHIVSNQICCLMVDALKSIQNMLDHTELLVESIVYDLETASLPRDPELTMLMTDRASQVLCWQTSPAASFPNKHYSKWERLSPDHLLQQRPYALQHLHPSYTWQHWRRTRHLIHIRSSRPSSEKRSGLSETATTTSTSSLQNSYPWRRILWGTA